MSEQRPRVILALTLPAERLLEHLLFAEEDPPLRLLASAVEADELQRVAAEQHPLAVLLSPGLSGLRSVHCERMRAAGVRLVGLACDERERRMLAALGIDETIDPDVSCEQLLEATTGTGKQPHTAAGVVSAAPVPVERRRETAGCVLAVVGSNGTPGASECACSLAAIADDRWRALLIELDMLGGNLDLRLGADTRHGSLLGLVKAAQNGQGVQRELLERWTLAREGWPEVLLAPADSERRSELAAPGAIARALAALADLYPLTVCDVGHLLADAGEVPPAARVHREALVSADAVLLIVGAREAQVWEGMRQLDLLQGTLGIAAERLRIAINTLGAPASASRSAIAENIEQTLLEHGLSVDAWLPFDQRGLRRAAGRGVPLALARPRGGYARELERLLDELFLPASGATPRAKRRKRRLAISEPRKHDTPETLEAEEVALPWQQN